MIREACDDDGADGRAVRCRAARPAGRAGPRCRQSKPRVQPVTALAHPGRGRARPGCGRWRYRLRHRRVDDASPEATGSPISPRRSPRPAPVRRPSISARLREGATAINISFTCLTAGNFTFADGASVQCDRADVRRRSPPVATYTMPIARGRQQHHDHRHARCSLASDRDLRLGDHDRVGRQRQRPNLRRPEPARHPRPRSP